MSAINKTWVLAGNAIFTIETSEAARQHGFASHYTLLIEKVNMRASGNFPACTKWFAKILTGPDNTNDYTYVGMVDDRDGNVKLTAKSPPAPHFHSPVNVLRRALSRVWAADVDSINSNGWSIQHAGLCGRCGAMLTVPASIASGYGPECVKRATGISMKKYLVAIGATDEVANLEAVVDHAVAEADIETREYVESIRAYEMQA